MFFVIFVSSRYAGVQSAPPPLKLPVRLSRKPRTGPTRSRSDTRGCSRCSMRRARSATSAGTSIGWAATATARRCCGSTHRRRSRAWHCSWSTIPTAPRTSGCGRPPSSAIGGSRCRTARRGFSAPISASRTSRSATSTSTEYTLLGDETLDGVSCWKIQSTPKEAKASQYTRSHVWIRKDNYALARVENFLKDQVVRRLVYSDLANIQGIWTARTLEMSDLRRGSRTRLTLDKLQYNVPMKDEDFTLQAIRRQ